MEDWTNVAKKHKPKHLWLWCAVIGFVGYAIGRIGSILWGYMNILHHWVPALIIIVLSPFLRKNWWWVLVLSFGIGLFVSDLNDAVHLKIWGVDDVEVQRFWGVD